MGSLAELEHCLAVGFVSRLRNESQGLCRRHVDMDFLGQVIPIATSETDLRSDLFCDFHVFFWFLARYFIDFRWLAALLDPMWDGLFRPPCKPAQGFFLLKICLLTMSTRWRQTAPACDLNHTGGLTPGSRRGAVPARFDVWLVRRMTSLAACMQAVF